MYSTTYQSWLAPERGPETDPATARDDDLGWQAIQTGLGTLTMENDTFSYPIAGQRELSLTIGKDPGGDEEQVRITGRRDRLFGARIAGLTDAFQ